MPGNNLHRCLLGTPVWVNILSCGSQLQGDAIDFKMLKLQTAHNWKKGKERRRIFSYVYNWSFKNVGVFLTTHSRFSFPICIPGNFHKTSSSKSALLSCIRSETRVALLALVSSRVFSFFVDPSSFGLARKSLKVVNFKWKLISCFFKELLHRIWEKSNKFWLLRLCVFLEYGTHEVLLILLFPSPILCHSSAWACFRSSL